MCKTVLLTASESRRPTCHDGATAGSIMAAQKLGVTFLIYMNQQRDSHRYSCQHRQREELAQHTVVHVYRGLRQVTAAMVVQTVHTSHLGTLGRLVHVNRRQQQYWQEYRQHHKCRYLSLHHFHACKSTKISANAPTSPRKSRSI